MPADRPDYGVDAPTVPVLIGLGALVALVIGAIELAGGTAAGLWFVVVGLAMGGQAFLFLHTTRRGKFAVWSEILDRLDLRGDEQIVDLGCGRGAVLIAATKRAPRGHGTGVDLWRSIDQSGNSTEATEANAVAEGVADRVTLATGDLTDVPLPAASFDLVVSSLAIHNIRAPEGRDAAIDEAIRLLRPGGRLAIADIKASREYETRLRDSGMADVQRKGLGWRFWYGGPWMGTSLVTATRPTG